MVKLQLKPSRRSQSVSQELTAEQGGAAPSCLDHLQQGKIWRIDNQTLWTMKYLNSSSDCNSPESHIGKPLSVFPISISSLPVLPFSPPQSRSGAAPAEGGSVMKSNLNISPNLSKSTALLHSTSSITWLPLKTSLFSFSATIVNLLLPILDLLLLLHHLIWLGGGAVVLGIYLSSCH